MILGLYTKHPTSLLSKRIPLCYFSALDPISRSTFEKQSTKCRISKYDLKYSNGVLGQNNPEYTTNGFSLKNGKSVTII